MRDAPFALCTEGFPAFSPKPPKRYSSSQLDYKVEPDRSQNLVKNGSLGLGSLQYQETLRVTMETLCAAPNARFNNSVPITSIHAVLI